MALALAEAGADVAICDLLEEAGQGQDELAGLGRRSLFAKVNITRAVEIEAFVTQVVAQLGKIDILVNNAGISSDGLSFEDEPGRRLAPHDRHQSLVNVLRGQDEWRDI